VPNSQPEPHQLEISVFGPGTGECIVAHLGDGDWMVVDSCIDRKTGEPIALQYLKSLNVNVASSVKMVVATHWHDDHIRGLSKVLRAAKNASFVDSAAYRTVELSRVVRLGAQTTSNASVTEEYSNIYQVLVERKKAQEKIEAVGPMQASANKRLMNLSDPNRTVNAEIIALSPSDGTLNHAQAELENALALYLERKRPSRQGPNQLCVVLWVKVGVLQAILGADLEHVSGSTEGWRAIVGSSARPEGRAGIFKIPHHGSKNAHSPDCWDTLLSNNPVAVVTPFAQSSLPSKNDLQRLCKLTPEVYLTSDFTFYKAPPLDHTVEKMLRRGGVKRRALEGPMGHVRLRADARDENQKTVIELFEGAERKCA
jgi:beta-lactamase superfamily II metal-dependent hydrolase